MKTNPIIASFVADVHISLRPPIARSCEPSWLEAQARPIRQVKAIALKYGVPIFVAGDLFDKHNPPPELLAWCLREMPQVVAIAGNHDLPGHRLDQKHRSAYGVLVEAGRIIDLTEPKQFTGPGGTPYRVHPFPCGIPIQPLKDPHDLHVEIALIHDYCWMKGKGHPGASDESRVKNRKGNLLGYDVAVFGDNHIPFDAHGTGHGDWIHNCGGLQRRRIDEQDHRPSVGLLRADGTIIREYLDCEEDKFLAREEIQKLGESLDASGFIDSLEHFADSALDFGEAVERALNSIDVSEEVRCMVVECLERNER